MSPHLQPATRNLLLLFAGSLLLHLAGTWALPLIDRDEPRFAEASREMLERGDFVVPYFNNRYRFDKPPLIYWLQAASYRLLGESEFAARLPSAIGASLTAVLLLLWGRQIGGERVGLMAAVMFTTCFQTFVHARAAVADMWMVLFVTGAHWAGYELLRDRLGERRTSNEERRTSNEETQAHWWWIFYVSLAFAFLAKGPIGWTPLLAVAATKLFLRDVQLGRRFLFCWGVPLMLSIVALWGIPALVRTDGEFFQVGIGKHVVARSVVAMEGHGARSLLTYIATLPFYFVTIFLTFLPWALSLPRLSIKLWRRRDPLDNYLIAGAAIVFVIFTFVKTKLPHYTLPALPLLALLLARSFAERPGGQRHVARAALLAATIGLLLAAASPLAARLFPAVTLMRKAQSDLRPEMEFGAVDYRDPSLVWYFRKHIKGWMTELNEEGVTSYMEQPGARFVVMPRSTFAKLYPRLPEGWKTYTASGFSTATLKPLDLTMVLKPL